LFYKFSNFFLNYSNAQGSQIQFPRQKCSGQKDFCASHEICRQLNKNKVIYHGRGVVDYTFTMLVHVRI
jgi:hypothetical protein